MPMKAARTDQIEDNQIKVLHKQYSYRKVLDSKTYCNVTKVWSICDMICDIRFLQLKKKNLISLNEPLLNQGRQYYS